MSDQDPNRPDRPSHTFPTPPSQLLDANFHFTPYYVPNAEASRFPGHATPHLHNSLHHPAQLFPVPRNPFPGTDPMMDVRKEVCYHSSLPLCVIYKLILSHRPKNSAGLK